jgi:hypothetical protein
MNRVLLIALTLTTPACFLGPSVEHTPIQTCFTQPRLYCSPGGECRYEIDHYQQYHSCPKERVK